MLNTFLKHYLMIPPAERKDALKDLVLTLDSADINVLRAAISAKYDPFAKLPVELIIRTFGFLDPYDVWSKRLVSRRWAAALSSEDLMRSAVARLKDHDPADSGLPDNLSISVPPADELRHTQALRLGRPFSSLCFEDEIADDEYYSHEHPQFQLKGRFFAYLKGKHRESYRVVVRDLISGQTETLFGEAREKITGLTLTSEIVAFATYTGVLYVTDLNGLPNTRKAVRLPSARVRCLAGDKSVLACILYGNDEHTIVIHDAALKRTRSVAFTSSNLPQGDQLAVPDCLVVDSAHESIHVLFLVNSRVDGGPPYCCAKLGAQRLGFDGSFEEQQVGKEDQIWKSPWLHKDWNRKTELFKRPFLGNVRPAGRKGVFQLCGGPAYYLYDTSTMDFTQVEFSEFCEKPDLDTRLGRPSIWKGHVYQVSSEVYPKLTLMLPQPRKISRVSASVVNDHVCGSYAVWSPSSLAIDREGFSGRLIEGGVNYVGVNDSFAVICLPFVGVIQVLCFDERIQMHGSQSTDLWTNLTESGEHCSIENGGVLSHHVFRGFDGDHCQNKSPGSKPHWKWEKTRWKMPYFERSQD